MKFRKIEITNFMRYQGTHVIEFSCDPDKNVTVVMGDNTFGKTTLAQAFRWGLYGEIIDTRYGKSRDTVLLNKDVVATMDVESKETVSVLLEVEEKDMIIQFRRDAVYTRPDTSAVSTRKVKEELFMRRKVKDGLWESWTENNEKKKEPDCVNENIRLLFPKELSHYFFFDGERWSDEKKTNTEIKNSINTLMGITPLVKIKEHTYNGNGRSVVKELEGRLTGTSTKFEDMRKEIAYQETQIARWEDEMRSAKENSAIFRDKIEKAQAILDSNQKIEQYQKEYKDLERSIEKQKENQDAIYADMIKVFSKDAYKYLAAPLLEQVVDMLRSVNLEGKDIPDVTGATLDYLLGQKICLCGNCIGEKENAYMEKLRNVIFPNVIGSYVGQYQQKFEEWNLESDSFLESIKEKANRFEAAKSQIEDDETEKARLEKIIDGKINFGLERQKMRNNSMLEKQELEKIRKSELNIMDANRKIGDCKKQLERETAHTAENRKTQRMIAYAKALYEYTGVILKSKEEPLKDELNAIIKDKFAEMFHEQEKYAQMGDDYRLHLYYKNMGKGEPIEELNLSEGEIIARNFVFIVSILELAQKKTKEEQEEESGVLNLPLVLDGPFSKLGDVNTGLIAKVLPEVSEQVIVFMLDKDWEASGLENYTLPEYRYYVKKDVEGNSSSLERRA